MSGEKVVPIFGHRKIKSRSAKRRPNPMLFTELPEGLSLRVISRDDNDPSENRGEWQFMSLNLPRDLPRKIAQIALSNALSFAREVARELPESRDIRVLRKLENGTEKLIGRYTPARG